MKYWPFILGTALLTSCAHYQPQPLAPEHSAAQFEARRLDDVALKQFVTQTTGHAPENWPPASWDVNTLTLAALYYHPDLAVARAQWLVAEAGIKTAGGRPNPTLSVTPLYDTTTSIPSPWGPSVNLDWPIETAGKRDKRIAAAEQITDSARWNYLAAAWQVRREVRAALTEYTFARQRLARLQTQLALQQEIVSRTQANRTAGAATGPELNTARMALTRMQMDTAAAENKVTDAHSRLAEALGITVTALDGIQFSPKLSTTLPAGAAEPAARRAALTSRADIRAGLADYAAAEDDLRLEIAKQFPDVHFNPGYQYDLGDNKWSLGLSVELPVLNQNQGAIGEAKARRELAAAKFLQLQAQVIAQTDRAVAGWQQTQAQLKTGTDLLAAAETQQKSVAAQVEIGASSQFDLVAANLDLTTAALEQLDREEQTQVALGLLEDALQNPADQLAEVFNKMSQPGSTAQAPLR